MTCQDCIHYDVCWRIKEVETGNPMITSYHICRAFKDKSRFVELPCKVGADIFYPAIYSDVGKYIHVGKVVSFSVDSVVRFYARYDDGLTYWHKVANIGKTVFLTREEAENALKARERK